MAMEVTLSVPDPNVLRHGHQLHWYRIERVLGQGGFGITYLATDTNLDQGVALKEYLPAEYAARIENFAVQARTEEHQARFEWGLDRFISEARMLARFDHPNIVRVHSVFEHLGTAYMVMRYEKGRNLEEVLQSGQSFDQAALSSLLTSILSGLEEVHRAGFIHRDIKPDNIYLRADGSPVLLDFGSARQALQKSKRLTILVAPGYAPFEQYHNDLNAQGPWTDIYGIAATLYRVIAGAPPVDAIARSRGILGSTEDILTPLTQIGKGRYSEVFLAAIDQALAFEEKDRPQSIAQWREALEVDVADTGSSAATASPSEPGVRNARSPVDQSGSAEEPEAVPGNLVDDVSVEQQHSAPRWLWATTIALALLAIWPHLGGFVGVDGAIESQGQAALASEPAIVDDATKALAAIDARKQALQVEVDVLNATRQKLVAGNAALAEATTDLPDTLAALQRAEANQQRLQSDLAQRQSELEQVQLELNRLGVETESAQQVGQSTSAANAGLLKRRTELKSTVDALNTQKVEIEQVIAVAQGRAASIAAENGVVERKSAEILQAQSELESALQGLQSRRERIERSVAAAQQRSASLEKANLAAEAENLRLAAVRDGLRAQVRKNEAKREQPGPAKAIARTRTQEQPKDPGPVSLAQVRAAQRAGDISTALRDGLRLAADGSTAAQALVGKLYMQAQAPTCDDSKAYHWLTTAAAGGQVEAQYLLAKLYAAGRGTERNLQSAVTWFKKAADGGSAAAMNALGEAYAAGHGVTVDQAQAAKWFAEAARAGDARSQSKLAQMLQEGKGVERDPFLAYAWYSVAAQQGIATAKQKLSALAAELQPAELRQAQRFAEQLRRKYQSQR